MKQIFVSATFFCKTQQFSKFWTKLWSLLIGLHALLVKSDFCILLLSKVFRTGQHLCYEWKMKSLRFNSKSVVSSREWGKKTVGKLIDLISIFFCAKEDMLLNKKLTGKQTENFLLLTQKFVRRKANLWSHLVWFARLKNEGESYSFSRQFPTIIDCSQIAISTVKDFEIILFKFHVEKSWTCVLRFWTLVFFTLLMFHSTFSQWWMGDSASKKQIAWWLKTHKDEWMTQIT